MKTNYLFLVFAVFIISITSSEVFAQNVVKEVPVIISGGFELSPVDHGWPVQLIGPALGVTPEVFREAFSRVSPAKDGKPTKEREEVNKNILMSSLAQYGITNDRLDEVTGYYRYNARNGEMWSHKKASAFAKISGGKIVSIRIIDPGYGYTSIPIIKISNVKKSGQTFIPKILYGKNLKTNGSIGEITIKNK